MNRTRPDAATAMIPYGLSWGHQLGRGSPLANTAVASASAVANSGPTTDTLVSRSRSLAVGAAAADVFAALVAARGRDGSMIEIDVCEHGGRVVGVGDADSPGRPSWGRGTDHHVASGVDEVRRDTGELKVQNRLLDDPPLGEGVRIEEPVSVDDRAVIERAVGRRSKDLTSDEHLADLR